MKGLDAFFRLSLLNFRLLNVGLVPLIVVMSEKLCLLFVVNDAESIS
jgi:hypothetical protein